jgi:hypothetical protein
MPILALERHVRDALQSFGYRVPAGAISTWRLKDRVLHGHADLTTVTATRFRATLGARAFAESMCHDFAQGIVRLQKQEVALDILRRNSAPAAWVLVTAYYVSFFAAHQLLCATGSFLMYFDDDAAIQLRAHAIGTHTIEQGNYIGRASSVGDDVRIDFIKTGEQPHAYLWRALSTLSLETNASDISVARRFAMFVRDTAMLSWPSPSITRNMWNYARPELYGRVGEEKAQTMLSLLRGDGGFSWCRTRRLPPTEENAAAAVVFVRHVLIEAVKNVSKLFNTSY